MTTPTVVPAETSTETTTEIPAITDITPDPADGPAADTTSAGPAEADSAAAGPVIGAQSAPVSAGQYAKTWAQQWRRNWVPPHLWTSGRPSLRTSWLWAAHGEHLPEDEHVRHGARAGAGLLIPFRALFLYLDWIFERPSRVIAAAVLVLAVIQAIHPMF